MWVECLLWNDPAVGAWCVVSSPLVLGRDLADITHHVIDTHCKTSFLELNVIP
jgi:hypothetical protein